MEHRLVSFENSRPVAGPVSQVHGAPPLGDDRSWQRVFAVLQAVGRAGRDVVAESAEWKKLDKTARTLTQLSASARHSPIVMLHRMLAEHLHGLTRFDLGLRGQGLGMSEDAPIHAVAFQNNDTLAIYITKPAADAAPWFLDLAPLVTEYTRVRCRVLSHAGDRVGPMGKLVTRDDAEVFEDMFLEVDLRPHEIMEFCVYFPSFA